MAFDARILSRMKALRVYPKDFLETFSRSSGPGGQNVNKVNTAATIRHVPSGQAVTASDSRSQSTNRQLAMDRLLSAMEDQQQKKRLTRLAAASKTRRQKAKRSRSTKRKMVADKRHRGETKKLRSRVGGAD